MSGGTKEPPPFHTADSSTPGHHLTPRGGTRDAELALERSTSKEPDDSESDEGYTRVGRVSCWYRSLYGIGDINSAATLMILGFHYNYFLLNVACVTPANSAVILLISRVWDGVNDPVIGYLSDRTSSRCGRRRPWILGGFIPYAVSYVFIWFTPDTHDQTFLTVYFCLAVMVSSPFYTALNLPYATLAADMTDDYHERTILNAYRFTFSLQTAMIAAAGQEFLTTALQGPEKDLRRAYLVSAIVMAAIVIVVPSLLLGFGYKERFKKPADEDEDGVEKIGFWAGWKIVFKNKAYLMVMANYLLSWMVIQFVQNNLKLYVQYTLRIESHFTYIIICLMECNFLSIMIWTYVSSKVGKKQTFYFGCVGFCACLVGMYFVPTEVPIIAYIVASFAGLFLGVCYLVPWSMLPDVVEVDELRTGQRREGVYYAFIMMFQKVAQGVGIAMSNVILQLVGYVNPATNCGTDAASIVFAIDENYENESVREALRLMVSLIPACFMILACIPIYFYPIDEKSHAELMTQVEESRVERSRKGPTPLIEPSITLPDGPIGEDDAFVSNLNQDIDGVDEDYEASRVVQPPARTSSVSRAAAR